MKKWFGIAVALLLVLSLTAVSANEINALNYAEIENYLEGLKAEAQAEGVINVTQNEDGIYSAETAKGKMEITDEVWSDTVGAVAAELNGETADMRQIVIGDTISDVLAAYPCDNLEMLGTYYDAVLYVDETEGDFLCGYVVRDGQTVEEVCYDVYHAFGDEYVRAGVRYAVDDGIVSAIRVSSDNEHIDAEAMQEIRRTLLEMQETGDYRAYPVNSEAYTTAEFGREDAALYGSIDILDTDPAELIALYGNPDVDEWIEDTDSYLRAMEWDEIKCVCIYSAKKEYLRLSSLTVVTPDFEGPRGVRIGNMMDEVIARFYQDENMSMEAGIVTLYGENDTASYGRITYSAEDTMVEYLFAEEDVTVSLMMNFIDGKMMSMMFNLY